LPFRHLQHELNNDLPTLRPRALPSRLQAGVRGRWMLVVAFLGLIIPCAMIATPAFAIIHPCGGWGSEAPNSPIQLRSPFAAGTSVVTGGVGYFWGDGDHSNGFNDYYAIDWSATSSGGSTGGMQVFPVAGGRVLQVNQSTTGLGNSVVVQHPLNVETTYGHLASTNVSVGQWVVTSTPIGVVGSTGNSSGPHLHLRFRVNGYSLSATGSPPPNQVAPVPSNYQSPKPSPIDGQQVCDGQPISAGPKGTSAIGDLDGDCKVWIFDYNILVTNFGRTGQNVPGDLDHDGRVWIFDYNILVGNFGAAC
jgi:Peptidase family M23